MKPILTIYQASNDTSVLYFEDGQDAQKYAGSAGVCAGINVSPVSLIQSQSMNEITDLRMGDILVSDIDFTKTEIVNPSKNDYSDHETRPEGYYKITDQFEKAAIALWSGTAWLYAGDDNEYWDNELNLKSIERVEL